MAYGHGTVGIVPFLFVPALCQNLLSVSTMEDLGYEIETKAGGMVKSKDTIGADSEGPFFGSVSKGDNGLWYASFSVRVPPTSGGIVSPGHRLSSLPSVVNPAIVAYATTGSEVSTKQYVHFVVDSGATHTIVSTLRGVLVSPDLERVVVRGEGPVQRVLVSCVRAIVHSQHLLSLRDGSGWIRPPDARGQGRQSQELH